MHHLTQLEQPVSCKVFYYVPLYLFVCVLYSSFVQYKWRQWKPHRPGPQVSVSLIVTYSITEQVIYHSPPAGPLLLPSSPPGWMILSERVTPTSILSLLVCVVLLIGQLIIPNKAPTIKAHSPNSSIVLEVMHVFIELSLGVGWHTAVSVAVI